MNTNGRKKMHLTKKKPRRRQPDTSANEAEAQVQFTPAKPFNRNRFLLQLATVVAVVVAIVVGMSIFFKVDGNKIQISGMEKYTAWDIQEASGVRDGDGLLGLNKAKISARIFEKFPYVETVRVGIKLPDTVMIEITERTVSYAVEDKDGAWWLIDTKGEILEATTAEEALNHTRILSVKLQNVQVGGTAEAFEPEGDTTVPVVSAKIKLSAALQVLIAAENNGVMQQIQTVDADDIKTIMLQYEDRFRVNLGNTDRLDYKIAAVKSAVEKMDKYQSGYLDASFTVHADGVQYIADTDANETKN